MEASSSIKLRTNIDGGMGWNSPGRGQTGRMTMPILSRRIPIPIGMRKVLGYLRYDTAQELTVINDLYRNELRLYKNFLQPVMKLVGEERIGGRIKRKYSIPRTPYRSLIESSQVSGETKEELEAIYLSLNPAELKRGIEAKLDKLCRIYEGKRRTQQVDPHRRLVPRTVTSFMIQQPKVGLPT